MPLRHQIVLIMAVLSAGCTALPGTQPASSVLRELTETDLSPALFGVLMEQVSSMDSASAQSEIVRLQQPNRVPDSASERLKLAYLLSREHTKMADLHKADILLEDTIPTLKNSHTRALARLLQRNIRLQMLLGEEHGKVAELTLKIQLLKGLEEDLQQHNLTSVPSRNEPEQ